MQDGLNATLNRAAKGDSAAWRALVAEYGPRVLGLLRARCRDAELAEELTQSVFCTVAEKLSTDESGGYEEQGRFESWLFRIAMNRLRDEMRRRKRQAVGSGDVDSESKMADHLERSKDGKNGPDEQEEAIFRVKALRQAMDQLAEGDREIVELRHVGGLSFKQIAELLDEPMGTVLARQHRALRKLKGLLKESFELAGLED